MKMHLCGYNNEHFSCFHTTCQLGLRESFLIIFGYVELSFLNPTVQEWVVNTGRESTVKSFLRGHQKSGPFLEDNDSAIRVKRLSGLKSVSSKDKVQVITKAIAY